MKRKIPVRKRVLVWQTIDGRYLTLGEMDTLHIQRALSKIHRHALAGKPWRPRWEAALQAELDHRLSQGQII